MDNKVLFVAGMHRSGTSLTAQWLFRNGVNLGESLLSGYSDNPYGHFEDIELLSFFTKELELNKINQHGLMIKKSDKFCIRRYDEFLNLINKRSRNEIIWGWKEPRSTLFLNEFSNIINNLHVLAVYRHPYLVIESLYKRLRKNKWYYTRNPLKKFLWFIDIDLNKRKWIKIFENTYCVYNEAIIDFYEKNPNKIYLFDIDNLLIEEANLSKWLSRNLGITIKTNISSVLDKSILNHKIAKNECNLNKALKVYHKLNKLASINER